MRATEERKGLVPEAAAGGRAESEREGDRREQVFLFLQAPSSTIFRRIADHLEGFGHPVFRINVCAGDRMFWWRGGAVNYRGTLEDWPAFLEDFVGRHGITAIIMLGDERPRHRAARALAARLGLDVYHIEMGYLRPDWIAIERGGAGSNSHFPNDPDHVVTSAAGLAPVDWTVRFRHSYFKEVLLDLTYNLPNVFLGFLHPHYRWHAIAHPLAEYAGYLRQFATAKRRAGKSRITLAALYQTKAPFFLYALQLETDYQLRAQSPFQSQSDAISAVLDSFAAHAPPDMHLLLKTHPNDNGLIDWVAETRRIADQHGLSGRVHVVEYGDLADMMRRSRGVVTVNSTVGIQALALDRAVKVLGTAIYDMDRLTDRKPLDLYWTSPEPPDSLVRDSFLRLLATALHERGNFYSRAGVEAGALAIARRIHERRVNQPGALVPVAPRPRAAKNPGKAGG